MTIGEPSARAIGEAARAHGVTLSLHTPYYINLSSGEAERREKNIGYVLQSCAAAAAMGAQRMVVHCGGVGKQSRSQAMQHSRENVRLLLDAVEQAGYTQTLCLETMGKVGVIGTAEEVCELVALDDRLLPCIDFGHLSARTCGHCNSREEFAAVLDLLENRIGVGRARVLHAHFSKIEYTDKGEMRHLTFADERYGPEFAPLARLLRERGYEPTIICESAGTQAEDALTMKQIYEGVPL